jgi:hypothetical protein
VVSNRAADQGTTDGSSGIGRPSAADVAAQESTRHRAKQGACTSSTFNFHQPNVSDTSRLD